MLWDEKHPSHLVPAATPGNPQPPGRGPSSELGGSQLRLYPVMKQLSRRHRASSFYYEDEQKGKTQLPVCVKTTQAVKTTGTLQFYPFPSALLHFLCVDFNTLTCVHQPPALNFRLIRRWKWPSCCFTTAKRQFVATHFICFICFEGNEGWSDCKSHRLQLL